MTVEKKEAFELDLKRFLFSCLRGWWIIALSGLVGVVAAGLFTTHLITPMYQSTIMFYVNNASTGEQASTISNADLAASQQLVNTYIGIVKTDTVMEKVASRVGQGVTASQVKSSLNAARVSGTVLFNVTITHASPRMALSIAQALGEVVPDELFATVEGSSTKVVDQPKLPRSPSSPDMQSNCMIGGLIGALLAVVMIALHCYLDVRIRDESDLEAVFDLPVLGQIPAFSVAIEKGEGKRVAAQRKKNKRLAKKGGDK